MHHPGTRADDDDPLKHSLTRDAVSILLVEDDDIEAQVFERAVRASGVRGPLRRARQGAEALAVLRGEDPPTLEAPFVVVLDLQMPVMGGIEFLDALRADPELEDVAVFVVTSSRSREDQDACRARKVKGYFGKLEVDSGSASILYILDRFLEGLTPS